MELVKGKCIDLSFEGKGVVKTDLGIIFVDGCFVGEEVEVEILYKRAGNFFGKIRNIITKSKDRIQPRCKICSSCGGCQFQQLSYNAQLEYKTNKVKKALSKYFEKEYTVLPCIGQDDPYYYRNKIQTPIGYDKKHNLVSGFYKANTHTIIPNKECFINDKRSKDIIDSVLELMKKYRIDAYDEDKRSGVIRHLLIRTSLHFNEIMLTIVTNVEEFKNRGNFVKDIVKENPSITTIVQNINSRDTNVILGEKERVLYGVGYIKDSILDVSFKISSKSFYQVNPIMVEVLYKKAIEFASLSREDVVIDAYCGIGTIGLIASKKAKFVYGVEIVKEAIKDAKKNAIDNNIKNVQYDCDDASSYMINFNKQGIKVDVVFVDPPRKGLDVSFINSLKILKPERIVYVSCDCQTLARDLKELSDMYSIDMIQPVDMFAQTHHVETVVALSLIK